MATPHLKFFRLSGSSSEEDLGLVDKALEAAKSNQIDVLIINDAEKVKELISDSVDVDQSIYVYCPFEGKVFDKLKAKGYRLIGPQCVISCLTLEIPVPKKAYPVSNVAMLNAVVCCSSMKKNERLKLQQLVLSMGGEVTGDFTMLVTHLVAKEVGSKKYEVACDNNIPSVLPSWIHSAWEKAKYEHFVACEEGFVKEHSIPIFQGCTVCVTGIDATKRDAIKVLVTKHGGVYSGELNMKTCTHLLVEHPRGQKYAYAQQWKLHCVSPNWLYDCLKKKHWVAEKHYKIEPDSNTTMNNTLLQQSNIQNTILSSSFRKSVSENDVTIIGNQKKLKKVENNVKKPDDLEIQVILPDAIKLEDISFIACGSYLEECKIFLCNRPGNIYDSCKKIVNKGGGTRLDALSDSISHVILWDHIQPELSKFLKDIKANNGTFPHVLSPMWLIDSCKASSALPEGEYSLIDFTKDVSPVKSDEVFAKPKLPVAKSVRTTLQGQFEEEFVDENTLMSQYMSVNHESTRISQVGNNTTIGIEQPNLSEVTQDDDTTVTLEEAGTSMLEGRKFLVSRCESSQVTQFRAFVEEYGGTCVDSVSSADYIIVPLTYSDKKYSPSSKEVTICWVEKCIEQHSFLDPASCFLFKPFYLPKEAEPLHSCVVSVSGYVGVEREHMFHLVELLGGIGQDYFARNDTSKVKASTHLILEKAEGSKYEASVKWNIPCVSKEWLIRCAETGKRQPEKDFHLALRKEDTIVELITSIEETNAHAWEKPPEKEKEQSIIAAPPCDDMDQMTFELSARGASLMGNDPTPRTNEDNVSTPVRIGDIDEPQTVIRTNTRKDSVSILVNEESIREKDPVMKTPVSNDFSAFNSFIANEKRKSMSTKTPDTNERRKEPVISSSFPDNLNRSDYDKSHLSFDFADALDGFQSPVVSSQSSRRRSSMRKSRASLPFDVLFTEALQKAVDRHCGDDDEVFRNVPSANVDNEETFESPAESPPGKLNGVVIVVSKKLSHSQTEMHNLVTRLGGQFKFLYDRSCTHFIYQGKGNDSTKDYSEAKKDKKYLVSPHWLQACVDADERVDEFHYPVTFNPRMSIDLKSERPARNQPGKRNTERESSTEEKEECSKNTEKDVTMEISPEKRSSAVQKKMEEIMNAAKVQKNEKKIRRQTNTSANKSSEHCHRKMRNRTSSQKSEASSGPVTSASSVIDGISEQSQGGFITYDDPTGRLERERILEHLKRASPSQDIESLGYPLETLANSLGRDEESNRKENNLKVLRVGENNKENNWDIGPKKSLSPPKPQISLPITNESAKPEVIDLLYDEEANHELKRIENGKKYRFLFSGINGQEKIDYGAKIEELGGVLHDVQYFNTEATHLIVKAPTKNEKYLSALASGIWSLHTSYLDASKEAGDFVDESNHEWGSQVGATEIALAARRWRTDLETKKKTDPNEGAFVGWVVLLCIESSKQVGFKRILEAGGAKLLAVRPPFDNTQGATHAFVGDKRLVAKGKVDLNCLHEAGVLILKSEYIADYLILDPKPVASDYIFDDVKSLEETSDGTPQRKRKALEVPNAKQKRSRR